MFNDFIKGVTMDADVFNLAKDRYLEAILKEQDRRLEFALRCLIPCPIKGKITKGKIRWRGLGLKFYYTTEPGYNFPSLCGSSSRSGKRKAFEINLAFDGEVFAQYQFWVMRQKALVFGIAGRHHGEYCTGGVLNQIEEGNETGI